MHLGLLHVAERTSLEKTDTAYRGQLRYLAKILVVK